MKNLIRSLTTSLLFLAACTVYGAVPPMNVIVSDAAGKAAFKGATNAQGTFATAKLKPGDYVVQFNSTSGVVKGNHYAIVVSAGMKKVSAAAVPGEKLSGGGVALKLAVGAGLNITGQVAAEGMTNKSGKKMVWVAPQLGSHMPGHWVEEGSAEAVAAKAALSMSGAEILKFQERH